MRKLAYIVAVLVAATSSLFSAAYAQDEKPEAVIEMYFNGTMTTGHQQDEYCASPRNGTTSTCNADYMKLYEQTALTLGWGLMYDRARQTKEPRTMQFYYAGYKRNFDEMKRLDKVLNDRYGPIYGVRHGPPPSVTTGQPKTPPEPEVFKMEIQKPIRQ